MNGIPLGDTSYVKEFLNIFNIVLHPANCTSILIPLSSLFKQYLQTFDVICVNFLSCANKECKPVTRMQKITF